MNDNNQNNNFTPPPQGQVPPQQNFQAPPPPQGYQPPPQGAPMYQPQPVDPGKGMNIASLVLGICGLVVPFGGLVCAIVGLILGIQGKKKSEAVGAPVGMAKAGIILSIIGIAGAIFWLVLCVGGCTAATSSLGY